MYQLYQPRLGEVHTVQKYPFAPSKTNPTSISVQNFKCVPPPYRKLLTGKVTPLLLRLG